MSERVPQIDFAHVRLLMPRWWQCETHFPWRYVTREGFWDTMANSLKVDDRIDIFAAGDKPGTWAVLIVDSVGAESGNRVKVKVMQEFSRR